MKTHTKMNTNSPTKYLTQGYRPCLLCMEGELLGLSKKTQRKQK